LTSSINAAALLAVFSLAAGAQTREAEIEKARDLKEREATPEVSTAGENFFQKIKDGRVTERILGGMRGLKVGLGGLMTGSGFALGPEYETANPAQTIILKAGARGSVRSYYLIDAEMLFPRMLSDKAFFSARAVRRYAPQVDYYGPGPDSARSGRSRYLLEDTAVDATLGFEPSRNWRIGLTGGYLQTNTGPGRDPRRPSSHLQFPGAPGMQEQTDFLRAGGFVQFDYRDHPRGARRGGNYSLEYRYFADGGKTAFSFHRYDADVQQFIPFFNERRVVVLRAQSVLSVANGGNKVPFYLQPTLGGSEVGRGFRQFRFYDDNLMAFSAEYRWEVLSGLDMALFTDAGKVFRRSKDLNLREMESSVGVGFRFNVRNNVVLRIDTGFSHEGFQIWLKFRDVF
jgi:hypothetical protein